MEQKDSNQFNIEYIYAVFPMSGMRDKCLSHEQLTFWSVLRKNWNEGKNV